MHKGTLKVSLAVAATVAVVWMVHAGSLEPPGPPAPTMKPLDRVEPRVPLTQDAFSIPASGSYYLAENVASATGLTVAFDDVTIDLNGFTLSALGSPDVAGISAAAVTGLEIRSGVIRGFRNAVELTGFAQARLTDLRVHDQTADGLRIESSDVIVRDCDIHDNGASGINVSSDGASYDLGTAEIIDNSIRTNGTDGILGDSALLLIQGNRVHMNGGQGIAVSMADAQILDNVVTSNTANGITVALAAGSVSDNRLFSNGGVGVSVADADATLQVVKNNASNNLGGDYSLDPNASAAPIGTVSSSPGAVDNLALTVPAR